MCGPIAFMLPVERNNPIKKNIQIAAYHIGRLSAYSLMGAAFGLIGKNFYIFGWQQQLSITIGVLMIAITLIPHKTLNKYNLSKPMYRFVANVKSSMGAALKKKTADTFFTIGFLNGFLPCGLVYMAIFGSIVSNGIAQSAIYMALFGLGTVPLMTTAIYLGKFLNNTIKQRIRRTVPVFVIIIGVLFILRGLGLGIPYISPAPIVEMISNNIDCH